MAIPKPKAVAMSASAIPPVIAAGAPSSDPEHVEASDHSGHRSEESEQWGECDGGIEEREATVEALQFPIRGTQHRLAEGFFPVGEGVGRGSDHKVL
jgi:hypothetical protein